MHVIDLRGTVGLILIFLASIEEVNNHGVVFRRFVSNENKFYNIYLVYGIVYKPRLVVEALEVKRKNNLN